jgi:hypothetical protein
MRKAAKGKAKGTVQLALEIPEELDARLRERCARVGAKLTDEVRLAIRRHLDYPPPDAVPPLGDAAPAADAPKCGGKK